MISYPYLLGTGLNLLKSLKKAYILKYDFMRKIIEIRGVPTPRPRVVKGRVFYPKKYQDYLRELQWKLSLLKLPKKDWKGLNIEFYFSYANNVPYSRRIEREPCRKLCDNDNLIKGFMDSLEKIEIIQNDRQLYKTNISKFYTTQGSRIEFELIH